VAAAAKAALEKKASNVVLLDMRSVSAFTDCFMICDCQSSTQIKAVTDYIERKLRDMKVRPHHVEGDASNATWVLMDYGDFIVHVFSRESREYYALENLWLDAPRIDIEEDSPHLDRQIKGALCS